MLADVVARADDVFLILAVDHLAHPVHQHAVGVLVQQRVPIGAPDDLDHVPAGAAEGPFQLLDDLAVAADRAVEPLEVAVDHEDQVIELFAGGQRDGPQRLRLVALAVAQKRPNARGRGVGLDAAIDQVMVEPGLVDRHDRRQPHRHRGKLPEIGHQPGMRIRGQPRGGLQLAAEVLQVVFREATQQERPGVDARRRVSLKKHLVGRLAALFAVEEVIERHFVERGGRGEGRDVPADARALPVRPHDHRHRIPADDALDAPLDLAVAGVLGLLIDGNRVDVGRGGHAGVAHAPSERPVLQPRQQIGHPL